MRFATHSIRLFARSYWRPRRSAKRDSIFTFTVIGLFIGLASVPVDLEQRDGRINRYGGLAIRKALVARKSSALPPFRLKEVRGLF